MLVGIWCDPIGPNWLPMPGSTITTTPTTTTYRENQWQGWLLLPTDPLKPHRCSPNSSPSGLWTFGLSWASRQHCRDNVTTFFRPKIGKIVVCPALLLVLFFLGFHELGKTKVFPKFKVDFGTKKVYNNITQWILSPLNVRSVKSYGGLVSFAASGIRTRQI